MLDDVVSYCFCLQNWYSNYKKTLYPHFRVQSMAKKKCYDILGHFGGHFEWRPLS